MAIQILQLSSLEKIFLNDGGREDTLTKASALKGERFSYQIAFRSEGDRNSRARLSIEIDAGLPVSVRRVGNVPSELPLYPEISDDDYLCREPGLYPDPLFDDVEGEIISAAGSWHSIWVTVDIPSDCRGGNYPIKIKFIGEDFSENRFQQEKQLELKVIDAVLPSQNLIYTQWFHADCIASYYGLEIFSEEHWQRIGQFMETAVKNGVNMILTPVFTPPLDTMIGAERPTTQLVKVKKEESSYSFDFSKLKRWIDLAKEKGIGYFEISHLFTQWGAACAPKIIAEVKGKEKKIFGWETAGDSPEYRGFLTSFLPALTNFLRKEGIEKTTYFHISDEPKGKEQKEAYQRAKQIVTPFLKDYPIIDALSEVDFYKEGIVEHPIPSTDHIEPFLNEDIDPRWAYYCCSQSRDVANRFFSMPSYRNRILGTQLYLYGIQGFLHWGYNFYYSARSRRLINPFVTTDGDCAFPSGDPFSVYPGSDGPIESINLTIFHEALQDMRAFQLLEQFAGKEAVEELIQKEAGQKIRFDSYPKDSTFLLTLREKINCEIEKYIASL
jgi:hypothetical protein